MRGKKKVHVKYVNFWFQLYFLSHIIMADIFFVHDYLKVDKSQSAPNLNLGDSLIIVHVGDLSQLLDRHLKMGEAVIAN